MERKALGLCFILLLVLAFWGCGSQPGSPPAGSVGDSFSLGVPYPTLENSYEVPITKSGTSALAYGWNTFTFPAIGVKKYSALTMTYQLDTKVLKDAGNAGWVNTYIMFYQRRWYQPSIFDDENTMQPGVRYWLWCYKKGAVLYFDKPFISSLNPAEGGLNSKVTLTGVNFGASQSASVVSFSGTSAGAADSWSDTQVVARVPAALSLGEKSVTVIVGSQSSNSKIFNVIPITYYVSVATGDDGNIGTSAGLPLKTITHALSLAAAGQYVRVAQGTYNNTSGENLPLIVPDGIKLWGGYNTTFQERNIPVYETTVDGENAREIINLNGTGSSTEVNGFTFTRGSGRFSWAGGSVYVNGGSPKIINCKMTGNYSHSGGGIKIYYAAATVTNCLIVGNSARYGGGVCIEGYPWPSGSPSILTNCTIAYNYAGDWGGGLFQYYTSNDFINNCIFWGNNAGWDPYGRQIFLFYANVGITLTNCSYGNAANDIQVNTGVFNPVNCLTGDPLFITPGVDYKLQAGSPCLDSGSNAQIPAGVTTDITGSARIVNYTGLPTAIVDMGAYEKPLPMD